MHIEGTIRSADGLELYRQSWLTDGPQRASILLSHGLAEHSGRYTNLVERLLPRGYSLHALDHRGHGRSGGERCYVDRFHLFVDDLDLLRREVRAEQPSGPLVLLGHSMGGAIAAAYAVRHQRHLDALALSGPATAGATDANLVQRWWLRATSVVAPHHKLPALPATAICRDPAVVAAYLDDPLVSKGCVTARLRAEIRRTATALGTEAAVLTIPILLQHGEADELVSVEASRRLAVTVQSASVTLHTYPGLAHEVFNEPEHEMVIDDLLAWLDDQSNRPTD